ncbi:histidine-binding protein [Clostridium pasteurianum DSM 525 = ATCC 6013]|uniref:ABC-type transporter, periplasmic subunit family 3 n=1 Tax=Clostridium pasteurianum DSM 525 = ATCC 6013 TaxID=1262449 RepID=A0A0H3J0C2_CLOPA|nr:basic amino acid ABC transporter substrate-binding protein [Clostridium pasteurianum]AJA47286.1 histidine-binding protein [Clostridium pasteurianum DSM 525 = ATCC 6013]AJA51274.1 histidine-binding protein [Clostridium pasteurianum DSM 525 = ATCC 6013]AOZ74627.1 glutamine ABC transporter substrate-binding protein [Clostridium pasteurianum DSM 525 = ATCC 6013]AOZ78424.1 glutamine ABC transporter substrate-binding protein [Clostridium pasteurianum]ELP57515.1 amino acid ABC transporter periplas
MKRKLSLFSILLVIILLLSSCGKSSASESNTSEKKKLTILTYANWNPFEYLDKGQLVGFDIDLIKALADEAGYKYDIKNSGWDAMFNQIKGNKADLGISGVTITDARKQTYDFSVPYFISRQSIVVKNTSTVKSGADLKDKTIAVQNGSTGQEAVEKLIGKDNPNIKKLKSGLSYMELMHGDADAVVGDDTSNKEFLKNNSNQDLKIIQDKDSFAPEYFGIIYPKGSKIKADFDKALDKLYSNGTYTKIYQKWFKVDPDINELKAQEK